METFSKLSIAFTTFNTYVYFPFAEIWVLMDSDQI